jgi:hypothetical protein
MGWVLFFGVRLVFMGFNRNDDQFIFVSRATMKICRDDKTRLPGRCESAKESCSIYPRRRIATDGCVTRKKGTGMGDAVTSPAGTTDNSPAFPTLG